MRVLVLLILAFAAACSDKGAVSRPESAAVPPALPPLVSAKGEAPAKATP